MDLYRIENGVKFKLTDDELKNVNQKKQEYEYQERIRPRTEHEGLLALAKLFLTEKITESEDKTLGIQCMALFEPWKRGIYSVGDVRTDPKTGYPYECITAHDSASNPDWTIENRTLWKPWHSRSADYALPWVQPTGAHDMYKDGEYMIWTDKKVYKCILDTNFSPTEYSQAWEAAA
ncbi:MAG TPA: hypothetical protein IAD23_02415 [Candidatus Scubalenecus merdavium]|uniref:Chitin-binding type-3 domain-containing protein n=1 Tax=Candidatus Scybalenecus merdavium TaxID=2840939 RepID=A0A9D1MTN2_9FIRM|nr:hypothetical protein [Candidatus Scubalenecus merdavium]